MNIKFTINTRKAIEAIVWIVQRGESNIYNAMKIFFAADKYHLNKGARPVTGDRYVAMRFGTVPVWIYAAVKNPKPGTGFNEYAGKSFDAVMLKNHQEPAWLAAVKRNQGANVSRILFEDMIEGKEWLIEDLQETGHCTLI